MMDNMRFFDPEVEFGASEATIDPMPTGERQWLLSGLGRRAAAAAVGATLMLSLPLAHVSLQGAIPVDNGPLANYARTWSAAQVYDVEAPDAGLVDSLAKEIQALTEMPPGWDGAWAPAISVEVAEYGLKALAGLGLSKAKPPAVVPTTAGGLQFEWHTRTRHVELEFEKPGAFSLYVERRDIEDMDPYFSEFGEDISEAREVLSKALRA